MTQPSQSGWSDWLDRLAGGSKQPAGGSPYRTESPMTDDKPSPQIKQPPVLLRETQAILRQIETLLGSKVVSYWNNARGSVCHNDVVALWEVLEKVGTHETLYLFIKSDGGNGQASLRMMNLLRKHAKRVVALLPLEAASAATMLALGADEIQMGPMAFLTAVDTSLIHDLSPIDRDNDRVSVSLDELNRVVRLWKQEHAAAEINPYQALFQHVHPLVIGAVDRAESLSIMICKEMLNYHIGSEARSLEIAETLNAKYPSHSYPILLDEAKKIGLPATGMDSKVNALLLELNQLYSEMGQKATTDFDETRAHGNEIINIHEADGVQVFFQQDKDWFYRAEERRWITMNDSSGWRKAELVDGEVRQSMLHIA
ncbi:ATP-dependent Clp protease proteolytic subunit [Aeoliella sp. SH292]|uniref:ATP-dependent Clp protease proteolytic subunit n=1 Tax=Aeoliella sp. SH292 TaxID=3454464 RepID=UPI003F970CD5